jgi:nickel-dependent lactate racemase
MGKFEQIMLPYGDDLFIEVNIPVRNFVGAFSSKKLAPLENSDEAIRGVLENPIGSDSLLKMACGAEKILIIIDDNTRRTPAYQILPVVTHILYQAGCKESDIRILFASGTHRAMTEREKIDKIGADALKRFSCYTHDYLGETISLGFTKYGTPVEVNPLLGWSDFTIAIGSIIPHAYCGWGGGGKMILPGVSSARSILATHLLPYQNPEIAIGVVDNQARTEIDEAAQMAGLKFIINTILNKDGEIVDIMAGATISAHKEGIRRALEVQSILIPGADLVFGCSYPEHSCYWQANKAFHPMEIVVKPGGLAVMVASMPEGRGEHPSCFDAMGEPINVLIQRLEVLKDQDLDEALAIACALGDRKLFDKARVGIISDGLPAQDTASGAFLRFNRPDEAIKQTLRENPDARIVCLLNSPEMLPVLKEAS